MSSPITFGGFNNIDFNSILNLMMTQEQVPRDTMAAQQNDLRAKSTAFATLATKLSALSSISNDLTDPTVTSGRTASSTDESVVTASAASGAVAGTYDVVVNALAHAQVTVATSRQTDINTTVVADGGTLSLGGGTVDLTGKSLTLQGLADAINATADTGVTASIVSPTTGTYALMLTGNDTGEANAFTLTNSMTLGGGASGIGFTDTNSDGITGDSTADNAMQASDADVLVNNVSIKSSSNTIDGGVPGATLTLLKKTAPGESVTVSVAKTADTTRTQVQKFVDSYNDLVTFIQGQGTGTDGIGRDPLLQMMWSELRGTINSSFTAGGAQSSLAVVGVGFDQSGKLTLDSSALSDALAAGEVDVRHLFGGDGTNAGVFASLRDSLDSYATGGGLIASTTDRLDLQVSNMDTQLADMDSRLAIKKLSLQQQFTAADSLMSQLNSSVGSLSSLGSQYKLF
jgi:flagellar hook-associated protein 2